MATEDRRLAERGPVSGENHGPLQPVPVPDRVGALWRRALTTYVARFPIAAGAAVVVFVPLALLITVITAWGQRFSENQSGAAALLVFLQQHLSRTGSQARGAHHWRTHQWIAHCSSRGWCSPRSSSSPA